MIRSILLDFGNVMAFFEPHRAIARFAPLAGLSEAEMYPIIYEGPLEHEFESGQLTGHQFLTQVQKQIQYRGTMEQLRADFLDVFTPNPAVLSLLPALSERYRLVLASNTNPLHTSQFRKQFAAELTHFHELGLSWEAEVRKPDVAFFEHCLQLAECDVDEVVFVDDVAAHVEGAEALGIKAIQYSPEVDLRAKLAEHGVEIE